MGVGLIDKNRHGNCFIDKVVNCDGVKSEETFDVIEEWLVYKIDWMNEWMNDEVDM